MKKQLPKTIFLAARKEREAAREAITAAAAAAKATTAATKNYSQC